MKAKLSAKKMIELISRNDMLVRENRIPVGTYARRNISLWSMVLKHKQVSDILAGVKQMRKAI
jgi:hypothetical protein